MTEVGATPAGTGGPLPKCDAFGTALASSRRLYIITVTVYIYR
jgi:hypothetical protein